MSLPSDIWYHEHITEREVAHTWPTGESDDSRWEDCAWVSAVEWARLTIKSAIPHSHAEAEALRHDAGEPPTGGSNPRDVARGIKRQRGENLGEKPS